MRNLKKILALVLALIMSLSLMATAGATDFEDDGSVSDTYRQAVEVLSELGVFNGDQNGKFNPDQPITRAEVAAILYRIATGDIGLEGNKTYAPYNQFPDVQEGDWFAGYVTYCANAGYIKGRNTGKFDAKDNVTGYEVLAMILRAVGYDKNNEFVGSNWQLNTASIAREKGVLANVLEDPNVQLSQSATRQVVAELLFRASLLPQVTWNAASLSYREDGETLAKENLKMEPITGVVVANHLADLDYDWIVLEQGETRLSTGNVLDVESGLDDIGESRTAYIQNGTHVLGQLEDTGKNNVADNEGAPVAKVSSFSSMNLEKAEHYKNYSKTDEDQWSDWRIEYSITFDNTKIVDGVSAQKWFEDKYAEVSEIIDDDNRLDSVTTDAEGKITFTRVIPATELILDDDLAVMQGIFAVADSSDNTSLGIDGYVFAGTNSSSNVNRNIDLSDTMTYRDFLKDYIKNEDITEVTSAGRGEWLKVVDNNNDGAAEYVLLLTYELDEIIGYNTRTGGYVFQDANNRAKAANYDLVAMDGYEFSEASSVGDKVITARVDEQLLVWEADTQVSTIKTYNYRPIGSETVVTTDDETFYESDIANDTLYADLIEDMNYGTEYNLYFDLYNNIRAYSPVDSSRHYGLLTDMYFTNYNNANYIRNQIATVELTYGQDGTKVNTNEYTVGNHSQTSPNPFVGVEQPAGVAGTGRDWLQRAMAHLGMRYVINQANYITNTPSGTKIGMEFDYDGDIDSRGQNFSTTTGNVKTSITPSRTNVARYDLKEENTVDLYTVSEYAYNLKNEQYFYVYNSSEGEPVVKTETEAKALVTKDGSTWANALSAAVSGSAIAVRPVYAVDYVMLDSTNAITAGQTQYPIDDQYDGWKNRHVNAVNDTEIYIVTPENIYYYVGRNEVPAIEASMIDSMYAVAEITDADSYKDQYWVADVIVIELNQEFGTLYSHVFLNLWDNYRNASKSVVHELNGFDGQTGEFTQAIIENAWDMNEMEPGFYALSSDATVDADGVITAKDAQLITHLGEPVNTKLGYNDFGIYSGTIDRVVKDYTRGGYIEVINGPKGRTTVNVTTETPWYAIYQRNKDDAKIVDWDQMIESEYNTNAATGRDIIWVTYKGSTVFIADVDFYTGTKVPSTVMQDLAADIQDEQYERINSTKTIINFQLNLGEDETITIAGKEYTESQKVRVEVSNKDNVSIDVNVPAGAAIALSANSAWSQFGTWTPNADGDVTLRLTKKTAFDSDSTAKAEIDVTITTAKYGADLTALRNDANEAADDLVVGYTGVAATELAALKALITACTDADVLNAIIAGDWTKDTDIKAAYDALVAKLETALTEAKEAALEAAEGLVTEAQLNVTTISDAYDALIAAIEACENTDAVKAIYNGGAFTGAEYTALVAALDAYESAETVATTLGDKAVVNELGEVELTDDVTLASSLEIAANETVTINLNGNELTTASAAEVITLNDGADLTITGEGVIAPGNAATNYCVISIEGDAKLTVDKDVTIEAGASMWSIGIQATAAGSEIYFDGSLQTENGYGISVNGLANSTNSKVVIGPNAKIDVYDTGLYLAGPTETVIESGAWIHCKTFSAVEIKTGELTVKSGAQLWSEDSPAGGNLNNSGTSTKGCAIGVNRYATVSAPVIVTVEAGAVLAGNKPVYVCNPQSVETATYKVYVSVDAGTIFQNEVRQSVNVGVYNDVAAWTNGILFGGDPVAPVVPEP